MAGLLSKNPNPSIKPTGLLTEQVEDERSGLLAQAPGRIGPDRMRSKDEISRDRAFVDEQGFLRDPNASDRSSQDKMRQKAESDNANTIMAGYQDAVKSAHKAGGFFDNFGEFVDTSDLANVADKAGRFGVGIAGKALGGQYGGYGAKSAYDGVMEGVKTGNWKAGSAAAAKTAMKGSLSAVSKATGLPIAQAIGVGLATSKGVAMGKGMYESFADALSSAGIQMTAAMIGSLLGPVGTILGGVAGGMLTNSAMVSEGVLGDMMNTRDFESLRDSYESLNLSEKDKGRLDTAVRALDPSSGWEDKAMQELYGDISGYGSRAGGSAGNVGGGRGSSTGTGGGYNTGDGGVTGL